MLTQTFITIQIQFRRMLPQVTELRLVALVNDAGTVIALSFPTIL